MQINKELSNTLRFSAGHQNQHPHPPGGGLCAAAALMVQLHVSVAA